MSDYEFSVDDILEEFYKDIEASSAPKEKESPQTLRTLEKTASAAEASAVRPSSHERPSEAQPYREPERPQPAAEQPARPVYRERPVSPDETQPYRAPQRPQRDLRSMEDATRVRPAARPAAHKRPSAPAEPDYGKSAGRAQEYSSPAKQARDTRGEDAYAERRKPIYEKSEKRGKEAIRTGQKIIGFIFALFSVILLAWVGLNIHPESETMTFSKANTKTDIASRIDNYANNSKVDVLSSVKEIAEQTAIRKVYKIPENATSGPKPNPQAYGKVSIADAAKVMDVVAMAENSGLLDGQKLLFSADREFYHDSDIQYYYDETILVICWKEQIEGRVTSKVEVKIADGSQMRRKLCEDTYGSSVYMYCSELASQANAVVAMNSDYYAFRELGVTCYDRTVYRFNTYNYYGNYTAYNVSDTLFINPEGEFVFFKRGTETTREAMQQWVDDNNLLYSIAFGPILVENYEMPPITDYPMGEINEEYSRAGIAEVDKLHYLYMAVSHSNEGTPRCTVIQFQKMFYDLGVKNAYCLDGGQTGEVFFNGKPYNHIDFGNERTVSDIIYFATALGEEAQG